MTTPPEWDDRSVLGRAFRILGTFNAERTQLSLSDLARHTGIALATAHRLTGQLLDHGALNRTMDGLYELGPRLSQLGSLAARSRELRHIALPHLHDLHAATGHSVHLVVRDGLDARYVERLSGPASVPTLSRSGGRVPLHVCSGGLVLLAHADCSVVRAVLVRGLERLTSHTIGTEVELGTALAHIRSSGYAIFTDHMMVGTTSIAVALRCPHTGVVVAAIALVTASSVESAPLILALDVVSRAVTRQLVANGSRLTAPGRQFD